MARKVRFPLEMADGILVGNLNELQEHFNIEKVADHYISGKLMQWLEGRNYTEEANAVAELDRDAPDFIYRLASIFEVTIEADVKIDINAIQMRSVRIAELRQSTHYAPDVEKNEDYIAFDQAELESLLDKGVSSVYLYGDSFTIPLERENVTYMGIGNPVVIIPTDEPIDFVAKGIEFKSISFCENYLKLLEIAEPEAKENSRNEMHNAEPKTPSGYLNGLMAFLDREAKSEESTQSTPHNTDTNLEGSDFFQMLVNDVFTTHGKTKLRGRLISGQVSVGDKVDLTLNNGLVSPAIVAEVKMLSAREAFPVAHGTNIEISLSGISKKDMKRGKSIAHSAEFPKFDSFHMTVRSVSAMPSKFEISGRVHSGGVKVGDCVTITPSRNKNSSAVVVDFKVFPSKDVSINGSLAKIIITTKGIRKDDIQPGYTISLQELN